MRHRDRMLSISFPCDFPKYSLPSELRQLFSPTHTQTFRQFHEEEVEVLSSYWEQHSVVRKEFNSIIFLILLHDGHTTCCCFVVAIGSSRLTSKENEEKDRYPSQNQFFFFFLANE